MNSPILIFDGDCLFCNWVAYYLAKADKQDYFKFVASTSEIGKQIIEQNKLENIASQTVIVKIGDDFFLKSEAIYTFLKRSKRYPMIRFLVRLFPRVISDFFYDVIAKRRKNITFQKCSIPEPEIRKKFL